MASATRHDERCPDAVREFAEQAVEYVRRAVGMTLEYDSDTLPILDHYLRNVPLEKGATAMLVACAAGAYFGEVVRRLLGGKWDVSAEDPGAWRLALPGGLSFSPAGMALSAIVRDDTTDLDATFSAPPPVRAVVEATLERMGQVSAEEYYSLCCRLDTLEHLQSVLLAAARTDEMPN
jgi:hypothetical protein